MSPKGRKRKYLPKIPPRTLIKLKKTGLVLGYLFNLELMPLPFSYHSK